MDNIVNPEVPENPRLISIIHPENNSPFLGFPANNVVHVQQATSDVPQTFGAHYFTVISACRILTSETGFLSLSRDRTQAAVNMDSDGILTQDRYYYHLDPPPADPLYPICLDFSSWSFPHHQLPKAWEKPSASEDAEQMGVISSWTAMSCVVKARDLRCRLSGWRDGLSTAHIVPKTESSWVS